MTRGYPTESVKSDQMDISLLNYVTLGSVKQYVDQYGIQFEMIMKPDGLQVTLIKKYNDKSIRKKSFTIDNGEYNRFQQCFMATVSELQLMTY